MKKLTFLSISLILIFGIIFTSCTPVKNQLPVDPYDQPRPLDLALATPVEYSTKINLNPAAAQYFHEIKAALSLTPPELDLFQQNGFVVTDRLAWDRFLDAYAWIYWKDLPVLVTTDSILHSVHQSYDDILIDIERGFLIPRLTTFLDNTQRQLIKDQETAADKDLDPLYGDVSTYISVAAALLKGKEPESTPGKVLYSFATKAGSFEKIDLFGNPRKIDFTLFKPRGHYTNGTDLQQYFRSLNWLAQIDFRFIEFDPSTSQPLLRQNQVVAAALLRQAIDSAGERKTWNEINQLLETLVGGSDNVTLPDFDRFMADMNLGDPAAVSHAGGKQMLELLLNNDYGHQRITGQLLYRDVMNFSPEPVPRPLSFLLMGQRFTIDSYVLGNLVYDRMIKDGQPVIRALPSTLDVMYSLGNDRALSHLDGEIQKYGYEQQLAAMRKEVDSLPLDYWNTPTYNQWLRMLRELNKPTTSEKYPQAMRTGAWADKTLQTQLASWAQLRHDNILYVKQSFTSGIACEYPKGYVEPYPGFYGALYDYARAGHDALSKVSSSGSGNWDYTRSRALTYFSNVMSTSEQLKKLAEKELALQDFTQEEKNFLKSVVVRRNNENRGCGAPPYIWDGWYVDMFYRQDDNPALIADVHTNPDNDGPLAPTRVLHAATGPVVPICLVAETDEGSTAYVGPSFTYYDIIEKGYPPVRLTDQDWRLRLKDGKQPPHPDWTRSFLASAGKTPGILVIESKP